MVVTVASVMLVAPDFSCESVRRELPVSPFGNGEEPLRQIGGKLRRAGRLGPSGAADGRASHLFDSCRGNFHFAREFDELCAFSLNETVKIGDLLRRLRALSFPPYRNAYYLVEGKRVCADISLDEDEPSF